MKHVREFTLPRERVVPEVTRAFQSIQISLQNLERAMNALHDNSEAFADMRAEFQKLEQLFRRDGSRREQPLVSRRTVQNIAEAEVANADVPVRYRYLLQYDSFSDDVDTELTVTESTVYGERTFFTYDDSSTLAAPAPAFIDGLVGTLIGRMELAGWYETATEAYTNRGTNTTLRTAIVSYDWDGPTQTATVNVHLVDVDNDNIRYSTDGTLWTDDPPSDLDDLRYLEFTINGETVDFLLKPETELVNPVERIINQLLPGYSGSHTVSLGSDITDYFGIQIRAYDGLDWGAVHEVSFGDVSKVHPIDEISLTPPHLLGQGQFSGHDDSIEGNIGYYLLRVNKHVGHIDFGQVDDDDISGHNTNDYTTFLCAFEGYPNTELHGDASATASVIIIKGIARGMAVGDTLFIEDEQIRINGIANPYLNGTVVLNSLTVTRGISGTTGIAHDADTQVRGVLNADRLRNFIVFKQNGLTRPFVIRVLGYQRIKEIV